MAVNSYGKDLNNGRLTINGFASLEGISINELHISLPAKFPIRIKKSIKEKILQIFLLKAQKKSFSELKFEPMHSGIFLLPVIKFTKFTVSVFSIKPIICRDKKLMS